MGGTWASTRARRHASCGRAAAALALVAGTLAVTAVGSGAAPPGDVSAGLLTGRALAAEGTVETAAGVTIETGRVAMVKIGCVNDKETVHREVVSFVLPDDAGTLVSLGTMVGDITSTRSPESVDVQVTETIQTVDLLDGLVQATGVEARAHSVLTPDGVTNVADGTTGTTIASLVVAGVALGPLEPEPNTVIAIPLIGELILNEQIPSADGIIVNAMHLIADVPLGASADLVVASAATTLKDVRGQVGAEAYTARVTTGAPSLGLDTNKLLKVGLPCRGSAGNTITGVAVDLGDLLQSGTATNTVSGSVTTTSAASSASATVEALDVLDGLITGDAVTATSSSVADANGPVNSGSSELVNLVVAGQPIAVSVGPNTTIDLAGVGHVILNRQRSTIDGQFARMETTAILVVIDLAGNPFGLPVGATITIADTTTEVLF